MSNEITDITAYIAAKSDQINADDLIGGSVTVQLGKPREYRDDKGEARLEFPTVGGKLWRPCKGMVRLLGAAWGGNPSTFAGRWVRLYRDPEVRSPDGTIAGGTRVSGLSHIERPLKVAIAEKRGKKKMFAVEPLTAPAPAAPAPSLSDLLSGAGLSVEDLDRWRSGQGKPPTSDLTDPQRAALAGWLAADPARVEALRPVAPEGTEPEAMPWDAEVGHE